MTKACKLGSTLCWEGSLGGLAVSSVGSGPGFDSCSMKTFVKQLWSITCPPQLPNANFCPNCKRISTFARKPEKQIFIFILDETVSFIFTHFLFIVPFLKTKKLECGRQPNYFHN